MPQAAETQFHLLDKSWTLKRFPARKNDPLRAWDAADEFILQEVQGKIQSEHKVLIINDSFGAISTVLADVKPHWISDSFISQQACKQNLALNRLSEALISWGDAQEWPKQKFDWVLIKLPKSHAQLEDQLYRLRDCIHKDTRIIACAMSKNLHSQTIKLFEKLIGSSHTSLAQKKARLLFAKAEQLNHQDSPYPKSYQLKQYQLEVFNHAAVFSQQKLDIGTAFLLENFPENHNYKNIVDLGCGNGLLGIRAAQLHPEARIDFYDESQAAIASAKLNVQRNNLSGDRLSFYLSNCLDGADESSADLVLNNPPFHQQHSISSHIAKQMFLQSKKVLKPGGELWVIANRHLGYHKDLDKIFGGHKLVKSNSKFVILKARKQAAK